MPNCRFDKVFPFCYGRSRKGGILLFDIPMTKIERRYYSDLDCFDCLEFCEVDMIWPPCRDKTTRKMEGNTEVIETVLCNYEDRRKEIFRKERYQDGSVSYSHFIGKLGKEEELADNDCDHIIFSVDGNQMRYEVIRGDS